MLTTQQGTQVDREAGETSGGGASKLHDERDPPLWPGYLSRMIMTLLLSSIVASGSSFTCTPTQIWDGDGPIHCAEGPKIRLAGIAAREIDETCKPGHPCPRTTGKAARDALVQLVGRPNGTGPHGHIRVIARPMRCYSEGSGKGSRTAAWCRTADGVDLSCALVKLGVALRWPQYDRRRKLCR